MWNHAASGWFVVTVGWPMTYTFPMTHQWLLTNLTLFSPGMREAQACAESHCPKVIGRKGDSFG